MSTATEVLENRCVTEEDSRVGTCGDKNQTSELSLEIFFPTKDRVTELRKCLDSIFKFHPTIKVTIANCSLDVEATSSVLRQYPVNEIILSPDPGMNESFNILIENLTEPTAIWLSDDIVLIKPLQRAYDYFIEKSLNILGVGFIDNLHFNDHSWPVDVFGCAKWVDNNNRVAHFAICKTHILKQNTILNDAIDLFLYKKYGNTANYSYFEEEAYIIHDRYMDNTRKNRIL
jgi:hypothetical protein